MAVTIDGNLGVTSPDFEPSSSTTPTNGLFLPTTNALGFATNSTERLRLDASGNLGLGVTPSAWATISSLQVKNASLGGYQNNLYLNANAYYDGAWKYISTGYASRIQADTGAFSWFTAPSGTAGNAISFTQAMTLDANGNLGIGTSSPNILGFNKAITINSAGNQQALEFAVNGAIQGFIQTNGSSEFILSAYAAIPMTFRTGNAERARIDSSGNLLVGTTSAYASSRFRVKSSGTGNSTYNIEAENSAGTVLFTVRDDGYFCTGVAATSPYNATTASAANLFVNSSDGGLYRSTSSSRYKNSITDAVHGLAEVLKLRPVTYKGNNDGDTVFGGLIAEEVHEVGLTEFVQYNDDGEPDALAYGPMVSLAFKAIQELNQRLEALENK